MPEFIYSARDPTGKIVSEIITAPSLNDAAAILRSQKYQILKLKPKPKTTELFSGTHLKLSAVDKANFSRYMATMIKAGLPLVEAVATIARDARNKTLRHILSDVQNSLQQGEALSDTFARYPQVFDKIFVTIIRAGERSGSLEKSFSYLEDQLMASHNLSQKVKSALIYPAVIIATMFAVGGVLVVFVIPQIAQVFLKSNFAVPKITALILTLGLTLNQNLGLISVIFGVLVFALIVLFRSRRGKQLLLDLLKRIPGVVKLFEQLDLARFSRTLATLLQSGVPIIDSLNVATVTLSQSKFSPLVIALKRDIKKGEPISEIMRRHSQHIPQTMVSMIVTGEKTGTLDKILFDLATFYEQELETEVKNFTAILEPVVMLIIGVGVGGMVLAVIAPIYSLVTSLQQLQ